MLLVLLIGPNWCYGTEGPRIYLAPEVVHVIGLTVSGGTVFSSNIISEEYWIWGVTLCCQINIEKNLILSSLHIISGWRYKYNIQLGREVPRILLER